MAQDIHQIRLDQLRLDTENPRLDVGSEGEQVATLAMIRTLGAKNVALAEHLAKYGQNPAHPLLVVPDTSSGYIVVDGNRRLVALRLLATPELAAGLLSARSISRLRTAIEDSALCPMESATCCVLADRTEADVWIEVEHQGYGGGVGTVKWNAMNKRRAAERRRARALASQLPLIPGPGLSPEQKASKAILDAVGDPQSAVGRGLASRLSDDVKEAIRQGSFPVTNLDRLLVTAGVRSILGLPDPQGIADLRLSAQSLGLLALVLQDLGSPDGTNVSKLMSAEQRVGYAKQLAARAAAMPTDAQTNGESNSGEEGLPDTSTDESRSSAADAANENPPEEPESPGQPPLPRRRSVSSRSTLVPQGFRVASRTRIGDIVKELKGLDVVIFSNCAAVMLRVILDTSTQHYLREVRKITVPAKFADQIEAAICALRDGGYLASADVDPSYEAAASYVVDRQKALHAYIHNPKVKPGPKDLLSTWDNMSVLLEAMWRAENERPTGSNVA